MTDKTDGAVERLSKWVRAECPTSVSMVEVRDDLRTLLAEVERLREENDRYKSAAEAAGRALDELQDHDCSGMCDGGEEHMRVMRQTNEALTALKDAGLEDADA